MVQRVKDRIAQDAPGGSQLFPNMPTSMPTSMMTTTAMMSRYTQDGCAERGDRYEGDHWSLNMLYQTHHSHQH